MSYSGWTFTKQRKTTDEKYAKHFEAKRGFIGVQFQFWISSRSITQIPTNIWFGLLHSNMRDGGYEIIRRTKDSVSKTCRCDVTAPYILQESQNDARFDVVVSSTCLEAACLDVPTYENAIWKIAHQMLKPSGFFVQCGLTGTTGYTIGTCEDSLALRYRCRRLHSKEIRALSFYMNYAFIRSSWTKEIVVLSNYKVSLSTTRFFFN